ncbi:MAG: SMP-30/gluconolactonase/LRE family protein [Planctomycetales bacterium]|nr:SMP-30/gluconolactonase/LRE family protein [Planctomycetales bacterium]
MNRPNQSAFTYATALCAAVLTFLVPNCSVAQDADFKLHPDSQVQPGVPQGDIKGPFSWKSKIFPGTERDYWIYVPQQYDAAKPACLMVIQDGLGRAKDWRLTTVMDNLIHKKEMPVTIGIFINPGVVPAANENAEARYNRSFEYDSLGPQYAQFLVDEILPEVGKSYNLSNDPSDRGIGGASSGAICAFTAAWERPDQFRRVLSTIGTYVSLRGGNEYPSLIRKMETKPIRVFLEDGSADLNIYGGDWWNANLGMLSALTFSGYDVNHAWGTGGHSGQHGREIMADAMRWLWRDYPQPIAKGHPPKRRTQLLIPGEEWQLVSEGHKFTEGPAVNAKGEFFFTDSPNSRIHKVALDGTVSVFHEGTKAGGLMFGPNGYLYSTAGPEKKIVRYDTNGTEEVLFENVTCNDLVVLKNGGYYTDPQNKRVWHVDDQGNRTVADEGIEFPNGVIVSPDQTRLTVADTRGRFLYSFRIQTDGTLAHKQRFGFVHVPYDGSDSGADGMTMDDQGRLYLATRLGVQVFDQLGRCHFIIEKPQDGWLANVVFAGPQLDTLYATSGDKVFKRKLNAKGVVPWQAAVKPPKPGL